MQVDEIIDYYIKPRLEEECKIIGIPKNFILSVYGCYSTLEYRSKIYPKFDEYGNIIGVHIRIGDANDSPRGTLSDFRHELWHAKNYYCGIDESKILFPELRADLYATKRFLEDLFKLLKERIKKHKCVSCFYPPNDIR